MSLIKDKRGDEKLLSIWMFIIWFAIATVLVVAVGIFYSAKVDVRELQAQILNDKILTCIFDKGADKVLINKESVFSECDITKDFGEFYFNITFRDSSDNIKSIIAGNPDIEMQCNLKENSKAENFGSCYQREIYINNIKIITGSNNMGGNV